ncbi:lipopolysaccharide biosynthesis protein [Prescottella sp. R16]|uniref:lipopolysaccharide biosynthesis protein n=1 Tax=Prescottella sp. R16 TaxID=3064529 RepID=UPI00272E056F|nr:lipopolysaccharide biosynthesis protein [Prescottella sp. R16]
MTTTGSPDTTGSLSTVAARGASYTVVGQLIRIVVLFAGTIVLARILSPTDFGLVAIVTSLVAFGELVRDFGLSTAAAREKHLSHRQQSNLFWINTGLGCLLGVVTWLLAPVVASVFSDDALADIVRWSSVVFVVNGAATQFRAELNRRLDFRKLALVDTAPVVIGLGSAVGFVLLVEPNYWALVCQQVVTAVCGLVLAVLASGWLPGLPGRGGSVRHLLSFGFGLFGTQGVAYFTRNVDSLSLGYVWGPAELGVYNRAYQLLMVPINQVAAPLTRVAVPILTRVADQRERLQSYLRTGQLMGGVVLGITYGILFGLAGPIVTLVFGDPWTSMIPIFQALAIGGAFRALNQVTFWAFLAKGETTAQFRFYLVSQPLIVAAMLAGLPWGALGVAVGHSVGYGINWVLSYWWCGRVTGIDMGELFVSGTKCLAVFAVPPGIFGIVVSSFVPNPLAAIGAGLTVTAAYFGALWFTSRFARETFLLGRHAVGKVLDRKSTRRRPATVSSDSTAS